MIQRRKLVFIARSKRLNSFVNTARFALPHNNNQRECHNLMIIFVFGTELYESKLKYRSDVKEIRQWEALRQICKTVHDKTCYPMMAMRILAPELFHHAVGTVEAKKSLLLSLSPMLNDAEEQRKKDNARCEEATRCRHVKGKGRASYEYIDIDTGRVIDFCDYEKR